MMASVIQSSVLLGLALCVVGFLGRQSAAVRHAILAAGLTGSLAIPFQIVQ
jgi:hypothetical protein